MKTSFNLKFWLAVALQIVALLAVLLYYQLWLSGGEKVLLKLSPPRDPLSLLQGHYLILDYEISVLTVSDLVGYYKNDFRDFKTGDAVYIVLRESGDCWKPYQIDKTKPKGEVAIKGRVLYSYSKNIRLQYGIERYFIPEENWREVENAFRQVQRTEDIFVEVSVNRSGSALISRIFIGSQEIKIGEIGEVKTSGSSGGANAAARDARIISALSQTRVVMTFVNAEEASYDNFTCQQEEMRNLCEDIAENDGMAMIARASFPQSEKACIYSVLNQRENSWYCADSTGRAGFTNVFPGGEGFCVEGASAQCPVVSGSW